MNLLAALIYTLDTEARARDPPMILYFHVWFGIDNNAV